MISAYYKKNNWKIILLVCALLLGVFSLIYTERVVRQLRTEEEKKIQMWSRATKELGSGGALEGQNVDFLLDIIRDNTQIPVILTDEKFRILSALNIDSSRLRDPSYLESELLLMQGQHEPIALDPAEGIRQYVFYKDSRLLSQLRLYPYLQLGLIVVFLLVSYLAFSLNRRYEQEFLWVGMAKETAHQLGTPISGIIAWLEHLRTVRESDSEVVEVVDELGNDVRRLELIADRFSKIGAMPRLEPHNIYSELDACRAYMEKRAPRKVMFRFPAPTEQTPLQVLLNPPLFEWVIENLLRNSLDAMDGQGAISAEVYEEGPFVCVDLSDTGKGIPAARFKTIFQPGYTTKKRGWGLGLSLAKRIIEEYHKGKIFVKRSEENKGTTFTIKIPKAEV